MSRNVSRRVFLRNTAVSASAATLAAGGVARGYPASEKARIAWIGMGGRCSGLASDVVKHCPDALTVAVCDLIPERVERAKGWFGDQNPKGYADFRKMLDQEKPDGVLVVTQPCAHAEVVVPVLEAGFHCFAEKPMDTTVEKVDAIVKAARKAKAKGIIYQIGTQRRYSPPHIDALEMINSGKLGKVMFMQGAWHWCWRPNLRKVARDGGFIVEQAAHHTDVMTWAMGNTAPATCASMGRTVQDDPDGPNVNNEQQSATIFQWPGGEIFSYTHLTYLSRAFQDEKLVVHCEKAGVDVSHGCLYRTETNPRTANTPLADLKDQFTEDVKGDWGKGTKQELQGFVANVKADGKLPINANVETGRIATLMTIMARQAMINAAKNRYEPHLLRWKDIGSTTDQA